MRIGRAALPTSRVIGSGEPGRVERSADGPGDDREGDVVEHDRGDDLVGARNAFSSARDEAPQRPRRASRRRSANGIAMIGGRLGDGDTRRHGAEGADQELALRADVEQAGLEARRDRQAAEDQRGRLDRAC